MASSGPSDFDVEIMDIVAAAPAFETASDDISSSLTTVRSGLDSLGEFWGTNDDGPKFGAKYQETAELTLQLAGLAVNGLEGVAEALQQMAQTYHVTEETNTQRVGNLLRGREQ